MTYVYILSTYAEDGAEDVIATTRRDRLADLIEVGWPLTLPPPNWSSPEAWAEHLRAWRKEAQDGLGKLLEQPDTDLASRQGHQVHDHWGGMMLHVVELQE